MDKKSLYIKTLLCCSACDGNIANEEINLVKSLIGYIGVSPDSAEALLNEYVAKLNLEGVRFLNDYLAEVNNANLTEEEQMKIVDLAFLMIEADNVIEYSEVKFFKKIRNSLTISDDLIIEKHPDKEDFLLPDIIEYKLPEFSHQNFGEIKFSFKTEKQ